MGITPENLDLYKTKIIAIAKYFDQFCTDNNLSYFAIGGTAIGALRHNGIIPWDDDIDFVMPRPDYEKFMFLSKELDKNYKVFTHQNSELYHLPFAKMCDITTTLLPSSKHRCVLGAFIDIFPIDGLPSTDMLGRIKYFNSAIKIRNIAIGINTYYSFKDFISAIYRLDFKNLKAQIYSKFYHLFKLKNNYFIKFENYLKQNSYDESEYVAYFGTFRGDKVISPKMYFESYFYHKFEDFKIRLPIGIKEYLTNVYGDYMTPPPLEKRILLHSYFYLNLNKRITIEEIFSIIKSNHNTMN